MRPGLSGVNPQHIGQTGYAARLGLPDYDRQILNLRTGAVPIAAELVSVVAAVLPVVSATTQTLTVAASPDVPRPLQMRVVNGGSLTSLIARVVGSTRWEDGVQEDFVYSGTASATIVGNIPYETVSAITYLATGTAAGSTVGFGVSAKLGLPWQIRVPGDIPYKRVDGVRETGTSQINAQYHTWTPDSAPNAARTYFVTTRSTVGFVVA